MNELRILVAMSRVGEDGFSGAISLYEILKYIDITKSQFYRAMKNLIAHGFVIRSRRGFYTRECFYRWEFCDYEGLEHYG